jgi:sterol desaturase/sphingolipid hydroxylase (fatty acid hydroxylase superfamily)
VQRHGPRCYHHAMSREISIRLFFTVGIFAAMALLEWWFPRRRLEVSKAVRWLNNIAVTLLDAFLVRLLVPATAVGAAVFAGGRGIGFFNLIDLPGPLETLAAILLLDLLIYAQHVLFHLVGPLWKLHMMHHADRDIDVTTGSRFHPIEIILSMLLKIAAVIVIGATPEAVIAFEVILNGTAMFNHSNVALPLAADRIIRLLVVTPDMHRVHHSVIIRETNSNYGFNLSIWDRLFGTYRPQPVKGHLDMRIGLANFRDPGKLTLPYMLIMPFSGKER